MSSTAEEAAAIALLASLLLVPVSGCLEPIGEAAKETLGAEPPEAPMQAKTVEAYETAFPSMDPAEAASEGTSVAIVIDLAGDGDPVEVDAYVDRADEIAIQSYTNLSTARENVSIHPTYEPLILAAIGETKIFGSPPVLGAMYNASTTWANNSRTLQESRAAALVWDAYLQPSSFLATLEDAPPNASLAWNETTHRGEEVHEVDVEHTNETHLLDVTVRIDPDTGQLRHAEGEVWQQGLLEEPMAIEVEAAYGPEADHAFRQELVRLEAMTYVEGDRRPVGSVGTWTIQPSRSPSLVDLDEIEVQLWKPALDPADAELQASLPAEEAQTGTADARLAYEDVDGDGHVSPGDEVSFEADSRDARTWRLALHDEATGLRLIS